MYMNTTRGTKMQEGSPPGIKMGETRTGEGIPPCWHTLCCVETGAEGWENLPSRVSVRGRVKNTSVAAKHEPKGGGGWGNPPSRVSVRGRGGGGREQPPVASKRELKGQWWVMKPPSHVSMRGRVGGGRKYPPWRRNASRRVVVGEETLRLAFRCEGGLGRSKVPPVASKREPKGW